MIHLLEYRPQITSCDLSKGDYHSQCRLSPEPVAGHSFDSFFFLLILLCINIHSSFEVGFDFFFFFWSGERGVIKPSNAGFGTRSVV